MAEMAATKKLEDERRENLKLQREIQHLNIEVDKKHRALIDQSKGLCARARVCVCALLADTQLFSPRCQCP